MLYKVTAIILMMIVAGVCSTARQANQDGESPAEILERLIRERGAEAASSVILDMKRSAQSDLEWRDEEFAAAAWRLVDACEFTGAVQYASVCVELFPESWRCHEALGEANYYCGSRFGQALESYSRAVQLCEGNGEAELARRRLAGLRYSSEHETDRPAEFSPGEPTGLRGPYLGQEPPGARPQIFAPGIVSARGSFEYGITFSPDGAECYFTRSGVGTLVSRQTGDGWTAPRPAPFARQGFGGEPHVSPAGDRMFVNGAIAGDDGQRVPHIWMLERRADGWSEPRLLFEGMYATTTVDGILYVTNFFDQTNRLNIVRREPQGEGFSEQQPLAGSLDSPYREGHPGIAPDESYIVFDSLRPDGLGWGDIYVSFRYPDGAWSEGFNLGEGLNTPGNNICASISPDGKYLFYSANNDIWWISTDALLRLKPNEEGAN